MAKLYSKTVGKNTFACYSERGIVGYFMLRVLPADPAGFLREIVNGADERPFADLRPESISELTIFSELVFGSKYGFGNPDGAVFFRVDGSPRLLFYEAKLNETYEQSCKGSSYNSTIQGQLELKWRLLSLFKSDSIKTYNGVEYVEETDQYAAYYENNDRFYAPVEEEEDPSLASYRHLALKGGVKDIFETYVRHCELDQMLFLVSTNNNQNPLAAVNAYQPRCIGKTWDEVKRQFCWIRNTFIENCPSL